MNKNIAIIDSAGIPAIYDRFKTLAEYQGKKSGLTMYCSGKSYNESIEYNNKIISFFRIRLLNKKEL